MIVSLIASGSEVEIALEAQEKLKVLNINSKVISVPCLIYFKIKPQDYKDEILGKDTFKISIEASSQSGWKSIVGKMVLHLVYRHLEKVLLIKKFINYLI